MAINKAQPHCWTVGKRKKIQRVACWGLNLGPTDYNSNAPWPLGHTAVKRKFKNWTFFSRFRTSKFQTIFQRRGKKTNRLNTFRFNLGSHEESRKSSFQQLDTSISQCLECCDDIHWGLIILKWDVTLVNYLIIFSTWILF